MCERKESVTEKLRDTEGLDNYWRSHREQCTELGLKAWKNMRGINLNGEV